MYFKESLTLTKLLMSILCGCCDLESALTQMIQSRVHHSLVYYIRMFQFNTAILAKGVLSSIVDKAEKHFQQFVKLTDVELSNVQLILTSSVKTRSLYVKLMDGQSSSDYYIIGFLKMLRHLAANPDNMLSLGSSTFIELYHSILVEPDLSDAIKSVLLLLKVVCSHPSNKMLPEENMQLLDTLETLTVNENLQAIVAEVIWAILNEDDLLGMSLYFICSFVIKQFINELHIVVSGPENLCLKVWINVI